LGLANTSKPLPSWMNFLMSRSNSIQQLSYIELISRIVAL
jgi:hypothetical protein